MDALETGQLFTSEQWPCVERLLHKHGATVCVVQGLPGRGAQLKQRPDGGFTIALDAAGPTEKEASALRSDRRVAGLFFVLHEVGHLELGHYPSNHPETREEYEAANAWARCEMRRMMNSARRSHDA